MILARAGRLGEPPSDSPSAPYSVTREYIANSNVLQTRFSTPSGQAVLTDLMMPLMNGLALIRALRTMAPELPIIASTGLWEKAQFDTLEEMGVKTVLRKPFGADTLLRAIHDALH